MKTPIIAVVLGALLFLQGSAVYAEPGMMGPHHRQCDDMMMNKLDLTDEQREKMDALNDKLRDMRPDRKQGGVYMKETQAIIHADSFDEKAAKALIDKQQQMQAAHKLEMMKIHHEMYQLLTDDQKAELEKLQQEKREKWKDRKDKREKKRDMMKDD